MDTDTALADDLHAAVGLLRRHARRIGGRPFGDPPTAPTSAQLELIRLVRRNPDLSVADAAGRPWRGPAARPGVPAGQDRGPVGTLAALFAAELAQARGARRADRPAAHRALSVPAGLADAVVAVLGTRPARTAR